MFSEQRGLCAVCDKPLKRGKTTHVDHDHTTGKVRGLLHGPCNVMIGYAKDDTAILLGAVRYLEKHKK